MAIQDFALRLPLCLADVVLQLSAQEAVIKAELDELATTMARSTDAREYSPIMDTVTSLMAKYDGRFKAPFQARIDALIQYEKERLGYDKVTVSDLIY